MWPLTQNTFTNQLTFKGRYGCGGSTCILEKELNDALTCTTNGYQVCATFNGSAGKWAVVDNATVKATSYTVTTYDQNGNVVNGPTTSTNLSTNPLTVELGTITGSTGQNDVKAVVCATYAFGNPYNISLTPSDNPAGAPQDYITCTSSGSFSGSGLNRVATPAATVTQPTCSVTTGIVQITSPVSGATYTLTQGGNTIYTADVNGTFTGVATGTYGLSAAKTGECPNTGNNVVVNNAPTAPSAPLLSAVQPTCSVTTGTITVNNPLTTGYEYKLDGGSWGAYPNGGW
ncbi:MAG: hypothetical protein ACR2KZ_13125, partial [Segetibacter sp.]